MKIDGTILYEIPSIIRNITNTTVANSINNGYLEYTMFFDVNGINSNTDIAISFSNTDTFNTVGLEIDVDTIQSDRPYYVPMYSIYNTRTNVTYVKLSNQLRQDGFSNITITAIPFNRIQYPNGTYNIEPSYVAPIINTYINIKGYLQVEYNITSLLEPLEQTPSVTNRKLAYVDDIQLMNHLETKLLSNYSQWKGNTVPDTPSFSISSTESTLRMKQVNNTIQPL